MKSKNIGKCDKSADKNDQIGTKRDQKADVMYTPSLLRKDEHLTKKNRISKISPLRK